MATTITKQAAQLFWVQGTGFLAYIDDDLGALNFCALDSISGGVWEPLFDEDTDGLDDVPGGPSTKHADALHTVSLFRTALRDSGSKHYAMLAADMTGDDVVELAGIVRAVAVSHWNCYWNK